MSEVITFHAFCQDVLGIILTTGQRVIAKVAFGDWDPADLQGEERALALEMFGGVERVLKTPRKYVAMRLGRGSGKTTMCSAYAIYVAVTCDLARCGPGDSPYFITVAPDKETAKLAIRMVREMIRGSIALARLVEKDTDTSIHIRRPQDGRIIIVEAFAATRGGFSMRGRTVAGFLFDEAEFFTSNAPDTGREYAVADTDIFRAIKPRLLRNGKGLLISTPWPVETLMGEMFRNNWGKPKTALAIKAPTLLVRGDDPDIVELVNDELARDPENAKRELFCDVDGVAGGEFFDGTTLFAAMGEEEHFPIPYDDALPCVVACDLGFVRDSSTIAVVQYDGRNYVTRHLFEMAPKPGKPLKFSAVIEKIAIVAKNYGASGVVTDATYREAVKEQLAEHKLAIIDAPTGTKGKGDVYQRTRALLKEGRIRIPDNPIARRLTAQAKMVKAKASVGGRITIHVPRRVGMGHGDLVSAWTLAIHALAYRKVKNELPEADPGTRAWYEEVKRRDIAREDKMMAKALAQEVKAVKRRLSKKKLRDFTW